MALSREKLLPYWNAAGKEAVLKVEGLSIIFPTPRGTYQAVRELSFQLKAGETVALVGESGSGKSVTGKALLGLVEPPGIVAGGGVYLYGDDIILKAAEDKRRLRGTAIGIIFQDPGSSFDQVFTIGAQMTESILAHGLTDKAGAKEIAIDWLGEVGFAEPRRIYHSYPFELSGGMRQRAYIAMVMSLNPSLIVADEPTTALDILTQARLLAVLKKLQSKTQCGIVLITHDLGLAANNSDRLLVMYAGQIVECGLTRDVIGRPKHPYTAALIDSSYRGGGKKRLLVISGQPPEMNNLPPGCTFAPRCTHSSGKCSVTQPSLHRLAGERLCRCHRPVAHKLHKTPGEVL